MRRIAVEHLRPGMVLAVTVYDEKGRSLLANGHILQESYIDRLLQLGVQAVFIVDERLQDISVVDMLSDEVKLKVCKALENMITEVQGGADYNAQQIRFLVGHILQDIVNRRGVLSNIMDMRSYDDYTYMHCIKVCALSMVLGMGLNLSKQGLVEIGVGAIMHDIGKIFVPLQILNKPIGLNLHEYSEVQQHANHGFSILREYTNISLVSAHVAYQHHERYDGSGYPRRLKGDEIHIYARLVAVADVYDALTSNRVYRRAYLPHQAVEYIMAGAGTQFSYKVVQAFLQHVPMYPVGSIVRLTDNRVGAVVDVNQGLVGRPVVRILYDHRGQRLREMYEINLSNYNTLFVKDIITDDRYFGDKNCCVNGFSPKSSKD